MSDLRYRVGVDGVGESVTALGQVAGATRTTAAAASDAGSGFANFGQSAQAASSRIAGVANSIASLASHLGATGTASAAGLIGSIASTTAQFTAMGAVLGPGGALVGAIAGLAIGLHGLGAEHDRAAAAARDLAAAESAAAEAIERTRHQARLTDIQSAAGERQAEEAAASTLARWRRGEFTHEEASAAAEFYRRQTGTAAELYADSLVSATAEAARTPEEPTPPARSSGGRGRVAESEQTYVASGRASEAGISINRGNVDMTGVTAAQIAAEQEQSQWQLGFLAELSDGETEAARAAEDHAKALRDVGAAAQEATDLLDHGYFTSIEQVQAAWRNADRATRAATGGMISSGRLLERGMVAVGNNIAETIGGTMKGAFQDALGAWLDGSLSFVEAAERMAKGVIKALVTESIVQAIVEGARAIASIASQDYVGAATHAAAAAAWAAVGVVAGGVGAGIGAFGGGGEKGGSATSSTADASRERQRDQGPSGNVTLNVYPGGYITARDVRAGIVQALNEADREGVRPSFAGR